MLLTRPPLGITNVHPKTSVGNTPFDLHVLGAPPAFVLSQDQTLCKWYHKALRLYHLYKVDPAFSLAGFALSDVLLKVLKKISKGAFTTFVVSSFLSSCCSFFKVLPPLSDRVRALPFETA